MKFVEVAVKHAVATVTLHRPPVNALSHQMQLELTQAFRQLRGRPDVSIAVLRANHGCAGIDLPELTVKQPTAEKCMDFAKMYNEIATFDKPIMGVMDGNSIGAGTTLAALCHHVITNVKAKFGYPEKHFGLKPSVSAPYATARMGRENAIHFFSSGQLFSAEDAFRMNLVGEVVEAGQVSEVTARRVDMFLGKPQLLVPKPQTTLNIFVGGVQDPAMVHLVDTTSALYADRTPEGRARLVKHTALDLHEGLSTNAAQILIKRYLTEKGIGRAA